MCHTAPIASATSGGSFAFAASGNLNGANGQCGGGNMQQLMGLLMGVLEMGMMLGQQGGMNGMNGCNQMAMAGCPTMGGMDPCGMGGSPFGGGPFGGGQFGGGPFGGGPMGCGQGGQGGGQMAMLLGLVLGLASSMGGGAMGGNAMGFGGSPFGMQQNAWV